jgi:hypothetical protein
MRAFALLLSCLVACIGVAFAHPGASIHVAADGRVFFVDTGGGIFVVGRDGRLVRHPGPGYHWFALDDASRLAKTPWPSIPGADIQSVGNHPVLVVSSDFPVVVGRDGAMYYPKPEDDETHFQLIRIAPDGARSVFARFPATKRANGQIGAVNGLTTASDGSIYFSFDREVHRIDTRGHVSTIVDHVEVPDCATIPGVESQVGPYLRGLAVAPNGTVFVAAAGCGAVLMVSPKGIVKPVLRATPPYSPTAVAVSKGEVYVLEYLHTDSDERSEWIPRVRKITAKGTVETLVRKTRDAPGKAP